MTLVQIGSGSASLDTNLKDGFSNFILNKKIKQKILIVEANSIHIANLNKFWKFFTKFSEAFSIFLYIKFTSWSALNTGYLKSLEINDLPDPMLPIMPTLII